MFNIQGLTFFGFFFFNFSSGIFNGILCVGGPAK
uniref:Uncharacterized protein n=1 Tax=Rhizophora mucronata TaxID=61149 RepID=A0A2P2N2R3_RHIMU